MFSIKESLSLGLSANTLLEGAILKQERRKREVRQEKINSECKRMNSCTDTASQRHSQSLSHKMPPNRLNTKKQCLRTVHGREE